MLVPGVWKGQKETGRTGRPVLVLCRAGARRCICPSPFALSPHGRGEGNGWCRLGEVLCRACARRFACPSPFALSPHGRREGNGWCRACARRSSYWQTSTFTLSTYMPFGAGAVVFESVTARQRS